MDQDSPNNLLVVGSPRSGTHFYSDVMAKSEQLPYYHEVLYEAELEQPLKNCVFSATRPEVHVKLLANPHLFDRVHIIRRRDKVEQFRSLWIFTHLGIHNGERIEDFEPRIIPPGVVNTFLWTQAFDYLFLPYAEKIVYYEDIVKQDFKSKFKKMEYNFKLEDIALNWDEIKDRLQNFRYSEELDQAVLSGRK